jgi:hypothetical protein
MLHFWTDARVYVNETRLKMCITMMYRHPADKYTIINSAYKHQPQTAHSFIFSFDSLKLYHIESRDIQHLNRHAKFQETERCLKFNTRSKWSINGLYENRMLITAFTSYCLNLSRVKSNQSHTETRISCTVQTNYTRKTVLEKINKIIPELGTCTRTHAHTHTHTGTHARMHAHTHGRTHTRTHAHIHFYSNPIRTEYWRISKQRRTCTNMFHYSFFLIFMC